LERLFLFAFTFTTQKRQQLFFRDFSRLSWAELFSPRLTFDPFPCLVWAKDKAGTLQMHDGLMIFSLQAEKRK
jgi:hypothetical protein